MLEKRFREKGFRVTSADFDMPLGPEGDGGQSKGYLFAKLSDPDTARSAAAAFDGFAFDKRHTFAAWTFGDIERLHSEDAPSSFVEPERKPFKPAVRRGEAGTELIAQGHLRSWLADESGRDQLLVLRNDELSVGWLSRNGSIDVVESRQVRLNPAHLRSRRRNGPSRTGNGRRAVSAWRRCICRAWRCGADRASSGWSGWRIRRSSWSTPRARK